MADKNIGALSAVLVNRIAKVLARYPDIEAAFLFGSHAQGRAKTQSDLDLALVGPGARLRTLKLDVLADLTAEGFDRVDLVLLDEADLTLRFEALRPNCLVYAQPDFDRGSYYSRTLREYFDFEPYRRIQRRALKQRVLHGQG